MLNMLDLCTVLMLWTHTEPRAIMIE